MNQQNGRKKIGGEEIMAAIKDCAAKLGHVPSYQELRTATGLPRTRIDRHFANYSKALRACGLEREGPGCRLPMEKLFVDYAAVVRAIGEPPTRTEYELRSRYTHSPLVRRFGPWPNIPQAILQYAEKENPPGQWDDVLDLLRKHCHEKNANNAKKAKYLPSANTLWNTWSNPSEPKILDDRPVYGESLLRLPMAHAPVNEMGVVYLFGAMASRLGFILLWIGTEFPDGEALREVAPGRWQRVRIEFEFESRNFVRHMHNPAACDLIVCWEHNWKECPLEVVELRGAMG